MSISTKTGDGGTTGLYTGERVNKDDVRVEAYGTIDELNSFISETKHYTCPEVKEIIEDVHLMLYHCAAELACVAEPYRRPVNSEDVERITLLVHHYEKIIQLKGFVVPGSLQVSGKIDICRTVARRAERRVITLDRLSPVGNDLKKYLNRLSDLLFMLARYEEHLVGKIVYR